MTMKDKIEGAMFGAILVVGLPLIIFASQRIAG